MKRRKNRTLIVIIIMLLAALTAASVFFIHRAAELSEMKEAERIREEEAARQAEEEAKKNSIKNKIEEEKSKWYLILVNEDNAIPDDFEVTPVPVEDGYEVDGRIEEALSEMLADCREAGYSPRIISSFRTRETQQYLYDRTANKADTALPGHSEHECGLAADIVDADSLSWGDPLIDRQEEMPAQKWLMEHCHEYGFILRYPKGMQSRTGIIYEPWHYRYVGKEHAANIMKNGICLEDYLEDMEKYYQL